MRLYLTAFAFVPAILMMPKLDGEMLFWIIVGMIELPELIIVGHRRASALSENSIFTAYSRDIVHGVDHELAISSIDLFLGRS